MSEVRGKEDSDFRSQKGESCRRKSQKGKLAVKKLVEKENRNHIWKIRNENFVDNAMIIFLFAAIKPFKGYETFERLLNELSKSTKQRSRRS